MSRGLWVPVVSGPLEPYAAGYRSWLVERGYAGRTVVNRLELLGLLSRWLKHERIAAGAVTAGEVERFLASRRAAAGYSRCASARSMSLPLGYLRELGVVPDSVVAVGPVERLLDDYRRYLFQERGLRDRVVLECYVPAARLFLSGRVAPDGLVLGDLSAADVSSFLAGECRNRGVDSTRNMASALRCLLRYLRMAGLIELPLEWAVPGVADLRDRSLPRGVGHATVAKLLGVCDRGGMVGRRNYAIVLLLWRLGLRAGEVAAVTLDDVDWRSGEMLVCGKAGRYDRLPIPVDVGEAIVAYLRCRPRVASRAVFVRAVAPVVAIDRSTVGWIVRSACRRAGVAPVGAHALRHTAATEMLSAGASLSEIGQVLRHREQRTTARYAKVNREALRPLARPWPLTEASVA